jgi:hypothetical protein
MGEEYKIGRLLWVLISTDLQWGTIVASTAKESKR